MWNEAINLIISNGVFAVLFVSLLLYILKDSATREKKYQETIEKLNDHLGIIGEIKEDVDEIKNAIFIKKNKTKGKQQNEEVSN